jgi:hypothetical protein
MRNIFDFYLQHNLPTILQKSLINCHARGVDSILLDDTPGRRTRVFVARNTHELWKNIPFGIDLNLKAGSDFIPDSWNEEADYAENKDSNKPQLSVAIHPHHCDIELRIIKGMIVNINSIKRTDFDDVSLNHPGINPVTGMMLDPYLDEDAEPIHAKFGRYRYQSAINTGTIGFEYLGDEELTFLSCDTLSEEHYELGQMVVPNLKLKAKELHTIAVRRDESAAWFVFEGKEDPTYDPTTFSNSDLRNFNSEGMYLPMTEEYLRDLIGTLFDH